MTWENKPFTYENVRFVCGPRSYINEVLGEDIRMHTIFMIQIGDTYGVYHSRLHSIVVCTEEDVPW